MNKDALYQPEKFGCKKMKCDCVHEWQDGYYGKGIRLHNPMLPQNNLIGYRCTVCGKEKISGGANNEV